MLAHGGGSELQRPVFTTDNSPYFSVGPQFLLLWVRSGNRASGLLWGVLTVCVCVSVYTQACVHTYLSAHVNTHPTAHEITKCYQKGEYLPFQELSLPKLSFSLLQTLPHS